MKKLMIPVLMLVLVATSCGPKRDPNLTYFDDPVKYNDHIIEEQIAVFDAHSDFNDALIEGSEQDMNQALSKLADRSKEAEEKMKKLADYQKNTAFRDAAKDLFSFYVTSCDKELKELKDIYLKNEEITDADIDRADKLSVDFETEQEKRNEKLLDEQKEYAKKHTLTLTKDKF